MSENIQSVSQPITTVNLPVQGRMFMLRINGRTAGVCTGTIHNLYWEQPQSFAGFADAVLKMDNMMDTLDSPQAAEKSRSFAQSEKVLHNDSARQRERYQQWLQEKPKLVRQFWQPESFQPGEDSAVVFYVLVRFRQHSSWQGDLSWRNGGRKLQFRSVLELLHLVQSVLNLQQVGKSQNISQE